MYFVSKFCIICTVGIALNSTENFRETRRTNYSSQNIEWSLSTNLESYI